MYHNQTTIDLVKSRYKDEQGNPIILFPGQNEIFDIIAGRKYPRVQTICYTRYGKSLTAGLAVLTRASTFPEKWAIVAPSNKKAKIIMGYVIEHIFDNEYTAGKFGLEKYETREIIRRARSKERINFKISDDRLGEIFIISSEGKRTKEVLDALMGFGAPNVILDESSLIDDEQYAGVKRMLGDLVKRTKEDHSFLFEIGNPFRRNHFLRTWRDPNYHKILIDIDRGIREGRHTEDFEEEMKKEAHYDILYACQFPPEEAVDKEGWSPLLTEAELENALVDKIQHFGNWKLGQDVAGGGRNFSVLVRRSEGAAEILSKVNTRDTMTLVGFAKAERDKLAGDTRLEGLRVLTPQVEIDVDKIGVGQGVFDRLNEQILNVVGVVNGAQAIDDVKFFNKRAECYWRLREWILAGGKLLRGKDWYQLLHIKYKHQSDRKIQIIPKEKMDVSSPDTADALALTFVNQDIPAGRHQVNLMFPRPKDERPRENYL